ncbi:hypothetical protein EF888_13260 [Silicimonas algicola]|nr:hypothetical protein [Silicimonas algicola]AZQ68016.1 hypothetical protein EF888_13260 [Silicimonas algicola]
MFPRILALLALLFTEPATAGTGCEAATSLARIHDRYHAIVVDDPNLAARSAAQLLAALPGTSAIALAARLPPETDLDVERLDRILAAAHSLSRDFVTGHPASMAARAPRRDNVAWLARAVRATGCVPRFETAGPEEEEGAQGGLASTGHTGNAAVSRATNLWPLLSATGIAALAVLVYIVRTSRPYRIAEVERLPRHFTTIAIDVAYETPARGPQSIRLTALDISSGGMKLAWENAPPRGTALSVRLPQGERAASIVWSSAWYAGIMFDQHIPQDELAPLISAV